MQKVKKLLRISLCLRVLNMNLKPIYFKADKLHIHQPIYTLHCQPTLLIPSLLSFQKKEFQLSMIYPLKAIGSKRRT